MTILRVIFPLAMSLYLAAVLIREARYKVQEHEKLVVFRLGRPVAVRGPGTVWLVPLIESGVKLNTTDSFEARRIADYYRQVGHHS